MSTATQSPQVLEAALCISGKLSDDSLHRHFDEPTLHAADKHRGFGIQQLLCDQAGKSGYKQWGPLYAQEVGSVLKAAFSTKGTSGILSNVANKFLLEGFQQVESAWRAIAAIRPVNDFKESVGYSLTGDLIYKEVPRDGEVTHGSLGEEAYPNTARTYGRILGMSRQDIVNDELSAFTQPSRALGRGGALKLNDVFWSTWLAAAAGAAFWTSGRGNLVGAGSVLGIDGLTLAETAFGALRDQHGNPLGVLPKVLLVPSTLGSKASVLASSAEVMPAGGEGKVLNPHEGKFRVVRSSYLSATDLFPEADAARWWLLADPTELASIEVVFLGGKEEPTIESAEADFSQLGIQFRGYHDFGVAMQEYRASVMATGAPVEEEG